MGEARRAASDAPVAIGSRALRRDSSAASSRCTGGSSAKRATCSSGSSRSRNPRHAVRLQALPGRRRRDLFRIARGRLRLRHGDPVPRAPPGPLHRRGPVLWFNSPGSGLPLPDALPTLWDLVRLRWIHRRNSARCRREGLPSARWGPYRKRITRLGQESLGRFAFLRMTAAERRSRPLTAVFVSESRQPPRRAAPAPRRRTNDVRISHSGPRTANAGTKR